MLHSCYSVTTASSSNNVISMIFDVVVVIIALFTTIFLYFQWSFKYWKRKCVPFLEPSIPFGNMENPFNRKNQIGPLLKNFYDEFKAMGCKYGGLYNFSQPAFMPVDPGYLKIIMQNNFEYFSDRGSYYNEKVDPITAHLFNIGGQKWRTLRTKLTPTFTSGKMKIMFDIMVQCGDQMLEAMNGFCESNATVDAKDVAARFTTDIIGSCAFGLDCNSFKDNDSEFIWHGKNLSAAQSKFKAVCNIFAQAKPELAQFLGITLLPKNSTSFIFRVVKETVSFREQNNISRNDMLQILLEMKKDKNGDDSKENSLTIEEIAAQALIFFAGGFDTSSTTMSYCLFELALNQAIQDKVRTEVNKVLSQYDGKITYDSLHQMKYLHQVVDETLRKYPPIPFLTRRCVKDFQIPNTEVIIEKGTLVFIPIYGFHRDCEYFPDPDNFDPDRFSSENKTNIPPFAYIPFGEGPRICIALRFGMMQVKIGLALLLKNFKFSINKNTSIPLQLDPYSKVTLLARSRILLDIKKIVK